MSESAEFQLLERNLAHFPSGRYLVINAPKGDWPQRFAQGRSLTMLDWMYDAHCQHKAQLKADDAALFGTAPPAEPFEHVILFWPKEKALVPLFLKTLATLPQDSPLTLWLCGHNNGGIKSAANLLKKQGFAAVKVDTARHCTLLCTQLTPSHTVPAQQCLTEQATHYDVATPDIPLRLTTYPGVFSEGKLDSGTALLLEHIPTLTSERVLDFGCGCGVISCVLAQHFPQISLLGVDVNAFALTATEANFATHQVNGQARAVTGINDLSAERFDLIITNPPFHQGTQTDYDVTHNLIQQAPALLNKGGAMLMVANRFLKYPDLIQQAFGHCHTLAQNNKFSLYLAKKA